MAAHDDLELQEYVAAVAVTRLLLGPKARVQAPPNLSDSTELGLLLRAGVDDWGGVSPLTPDHVNPERPWPNIDELAALIGRGRASSCASGWPPSRRTCCAPEPWLDPRVRPHVAALAGPDGLAVEGRVPVGLPWQEPDEAWTSSGPGRPARRGRHRRAARATGGRTSTPSTATGPSCANGRRAARDGHSTALRRRRPRGARRAAARRAGPGRAVRRRVPGAARRRRHRPGAPLRARRRRARRRQSATTSPTS